MVGRVQALELGGFIRNTEENVFCFSRGIKAINNSVIRRTIIGGGGEFQFYVCVP